MEKVDFNFNKMLINKLGISFDKIFTLNSLMGDFNDLYMRFF